MIRDLCVMEKYQKDGEEKVSWNKIGIMFHKEDKRYIKLFHMPGILISVFDRKEENNQETPQEG